MAAANPPISSAPALPRLGIRSLLHGLDYQWQVLICAIVGTFMVMLDQTVVNIALPKITTVFGVGVHETQLVVTSYMLALAVIMPATGYLSDTFGTKRLYLITMALFTGGSLLCGLAWNNTPVLTRFAIGTVSLVAWVWVELTDDHPLLDLRLFKTPMFTLSAMVTFVMTVGMFGGMLVLPLFLQNLRGLGAAESGVILVSQVLPMTVIMPLIGRVVDKVGARAVILTGLPLLALTTWQMGALDLTTSDTTIRWWLAARGCAMGPVMMPSMAARLNAVPLPQMSRASSMTNVMRQVFGAFGTAIVVTILQLRQTFHTAMLSQTLTPENIPLQGLLSSAQQLAAAS